MTPVGIGRDARWLARLSERTGLHIVMGGGWYRGAYYPPEALIDRRSVEELADILVREAEEGVDGSGIRPGILGEIGTDKPWRKSNSTVAPRRTVSRWWSRGTATATCSRRSCRGFGMRASTRPRSICDEIVAWLRQLLAPVRIDDETLALDLVHELGPDGSLLETDHTLAHYRERGYPGLIERFGYEAWRTRGAKTLAERAADRVDQLLASHVPPPIEPSTAAAIHAVVERASQSVTSAGRSP